MIRSLTPAAEVEWEHIPGMSRVEKLEYVTRFVNEKIDYLILPTDDTIDFLETHISHVFINIVVRCLKASILKTGRWIPVSSTIRQSEDEMVLVYRNGNL
jgi:phosphoglycerate-specific signal transduction histidine kinase